GGLNYAVRLACSVPLPIGLRVLNGVGRALAAGGLPLVRLDERSLRTRAVRATGLEDFGDDRFREPLGRLLRALADEARLTLLGRLIARADLTRLLVSSSRASRGAATRQPNQPVVDDPAGTRHELAHDLG